jgi:hypothetical protein
MTIFHDRERPPSANSNGSRISPSDKRPSQPPVGVVAAGHGMSSAPLSERLGVEHCPGSVPRVTTGRIEKVRDDFGTSGNAMSKNTYTISLPCWAPGARRFAPTGVAEIASLCVGVMRPRWRLFVGPGNARQRHAAEGAGPPQRYCLSSGMLLRAGRIGR